MFGGAGVVWFDVEGGMHIDLSPILNVVLQHGAEVIVAVLAPFVYKKIRDRDIREAIAHIADAALVLAITKVKGKTYQDVGELIREVVAQIMADPTAPSQLRSNESVAVQAAAAAVSRAGIVPVQKVTVNADGSLTPVAEVTTPK